MIIQEKTLAERTNSEVSLPLIVGMGAMCSAGINKKDIFENVVQGNSSVQANGLAPIEIEKWGLNAQKLEVPPELQTSRCLPWVYLTLREALAESHWENFENIGVIFASTTSSVDQWQSELPFIQANSNTESHFDYDEQMHRKMNKKMSKKMNSLVKNQSLSQPLEKVTHYLGVTGPKIVISSSCSASLQALALGAMWIENQIVDRCIIVTTEVLCSLTLLGFDSIRLLSKNICKPFDLNRNGINLGEAAAAICLQSSKFKGSSPLTVWGSVSGYGLSSDAYHSTSPHPEGRGSKDAILMALQKAHLEPKNIDWIYAHGTASVGNDLAEMKAFRSVFGKDLPPVVSTKPIHGHTLAASGLLESVIGLMAMKQDMILNNYHAIQWDPVFQLSAEKPFKACKSNEVQHILKNSLGFGGINVSVVLSRA